MRLRIAFLSLLALAVNGQSSKLLLQRPALTATHIVFSYAGDLWTVPRAGGEATRLTSSAGYENNAIVSPDGSQVAFSGEYDGNVDVFTVPIKGGVPKRLTWHPAADVPLAFSPDGKNILFRSSRVSPTRGNRLFTVPVAGGFPTEVPLPLGEEGVYSPDGQRLAYLPLAIPFATWKNYRGGQTSRIWIANLADSKVDPIPREESNDFNPMWVGDRVYFLSDRSGPFSLYAYDLKSRKVTEALKNSGLDFKSASAGPGGIVVEQFGAILLFDLKTGKAAPVNISINADLSSVRPYYDKIARRIASAELSPTGARAVFEARGEIVTVPAEKGDFRNLTNTPGVAERAPAWSPDGKSVAYFSDESGEYALHIAPQSGMGEVRKFPLPPAFYWEAKWSPDNKKIVVRDSNLAISWLDLESKKLTRIDAETYDTPFRDEINPSWSPDSKWIVYTKTLKNHLRAVHVYSIEKSQATQITDGLSDARHAVFDKDGRYLYFTASTNQGLATGWLDMSSIDRVQNRSVYIVVLRKEDASPLAPESDEEKPAEPAKKEEKKDEKKDVDVRIDLDGISQRILALPIPARNYSALLTAKAGTVFLIEDPAVPPTDGPPARTLHKFELKTRKTDKVMDGIALAVISDNGEKMLYRQGERWAIGGTAAPPKPGEGTLALDPIEIRVEPQAEWRQMYREVWRIERDFFYDPNLHGLPLAKTKDQYASYLDRIGHRDDLNYLFREMLSQMSVGHMGVGGGALPDVKRVPVGLLGCDYAIENGRYRFAKVFSGENWNPQLRAPLTQPGVNVREGEYLLAVNGRDVTSNDNVYSFFEALSGKAVVLKVGPNPTADRSREVTVTPIPNENQIRYLAWIENNRRKVEQMTGGRIGYVHLPNTSIQGYTNFNRYFFAQVGKEGMVIDERFNGGGFIADYIIDYMRRPLTNYFTTRAGEPFSTPMNGIFGPKAMIINEYAGSGGDAMPWLFRKLSLGPLVGKKTWGGLVGIFGFPQLMDGGFVTAPNLAFYNLNAEWDVENHGVPPDVEIENDPALWRQGRDPQLEKAVELVQEALRKSPPPVHKLPAYPNYHTSNGSR